MHASTARQTSQHHPRQNTPHWNIIGIITRSSCLEEGRVCRQAAVKAAKIVPNVGLPDPSPLEYDGWKFAISCVRLLH